MDIGRVAANLIASCAAPGVAQVHQGRVRRGIVFGTVVGLWAAFGMLLWGMLAIPHLQSFIPERSDSIPWPYRVPTWIYLALCVLAAVDALRLEEPQPEEPSSRKPLIRCAAFAAGYWLAVFLLRSVVVMGVYWLVGRRG